MCCGVDAQRARRSPTAASRISALAENRASPRRRSATLDGGSPWIGPAIACWTAPATDRSAHSPSRLAEMAASARSNRSWMASPTTRASSWRTSSDRSLPYSVSDCSIRSRSWLSPFLRSPPRVKLPLFPATRKLARLPSSWSTTRSVLGRGRPAPHDRSSDSTASTSASAPSTPRAPSSAATAATSSFWKPLVVVRSSSDSLPPCSHSWVSLSRCSSRSVITARRRASRASRLRRAAVGCSTAPAGIENDTGVIELNRSSGEPAATAANPGSGVRSRRALAAPAAAARSTASDDSTWATQSSTARRRKCQPSVAAGASTRPPRTAPKTSGRSR